MAQHEGAHVRCHNPKSAAFFIVTPAEWGCQSFEKRIDYEQRTDEFTIDKLDIRRKSYLQRKRERGRRDRATTALTISYSHPIALIR